tara:strand:- start:2706 stop:3242 length:537 start_codon:yes stop_codon:yes gene_type:complete
MTKNKNGGSGHKKMARKHVNVNFHKKKIRQAESGMLYGKIIACHGGSVFDVLCNDLVTRQIVLRKKFKGRHKRDNLLNNDKMVLVGKREWQILNLKKKEKVDLLEVYPDVFEELKKLKDLNYKILPSSMKVDSGELFDGFDRNGTVQDDELEEKLNEKMNKTTCETIDEDIELDWDDI